MTLRLPNAAIPAVLALCALAHLCVALAPHAALHVDVPVDALAAGGGVALDRLFAGDLAGALEGVAAIFRG
jgi:hypothetical protein